MPTIPASVDVSVTPGVLSAGGSALDLNGLLLTTSLQPPIGEVLTFTSSTAVATYFGGSSPEAALAAIYFAGFDNSNKKPGAILFAQYPLAAVSAYVRGGNISQLPLATLQSYNATLSVTIDDVVKSATVNLSGATSFSNAASIIGAALGISGVAAAAFTGSIATTTLTVASGLTGTLAPGHVVGGAGVTAGTFIVGQLSGTTGGLGTYQVSASQTVASESLTTNQPGVTYDSVSGAFVVHSGTTGASSTITVGSGAMATDLLLTTATGAVLSQGAAAATPSAFMTALAAQVQDWASFMTTFDPDGGSGNTQKLAFAAWNTLQLDRFVYVCADSDATPRVTVPATSSMGQRLALAGNSGTCLISELAGVNYAAFTCGAIASVDFNETDGRTNFKFRKQAGLVPDVTDETVLSNLNANKYNSYGAYATANDAFTYFANGIVSGAFLWLDSFVNQIWLNNALQEAGMVFITTVKSMAYNQAGYTKLRSALQDTINQGLNFGAYRSGVTLSSGQRSAVNAAAGLDIATTLQQRGWYLLIKDASPTVRQSRGSPTITFFYVDGESVNQLDLSSIALQ